MSVRLTAMEVERRIEEAVRVADANWARVLTERQAAFDEILASWVARVAELEALVGS